MVSNNICLECAVEPICKVATILQKFDESAHKPLGVNITINQCSHFVVDEDGGESQ